ncbi:MAG TPA: ABC transporter permease, partial [Longimicrobiales bacterium]
RQNDRTESMDAFLLDLRYALRKLGQQRSFTLSVVTVLALGIGAATAMFSAVDAALLRPLPFEHDEQLVVLSGIDNPTREFGSEQSMPYLGDARALSDIFTGVSAVAPGGLNLTDTQSPVRLRVALATIDLFHTLGVEVAHGRGFTVEEGKPDGPLAAILSDNLWRRQFGADPGVIGREIRLNGKPHMIVGIMPRGFGYPSETELWLPMPVPMTLARWEAFRGWMPTTYIARLAPGATTAQAEDRLTTLIRRFQKPEQRAAPLEDGPVERFRDVLVGNRRTALLVLMGATALVLLVACANVTNLLLSRASARRDEIALRAALGASRGRLVRQLLVESVVLSTTGAAAGVILAWVSLGALNALTPAAMAGTVRATIDVRVLLFSLAAALITGVGFGLWPAVGASAADAGETMKNGNAGEATVREGARLRRAFVIAEVALALMLAVGAGLMLRSLQTLLSTDPGMKADAVATLELTLPRATYPTAAARSVFYDAVLERLRSAPGVEAAAIVNELPLRGKSSISVTARREGAPPASMEEMKFAQLLHVTSDYFNAMGIPLIRGTGFSASPDTARPEVVINRTLAAELWPGENPIGQRMASMFGDGGKGPVVVGVVGDVSAGSIESEPTAQMYYPAETSPPSNAAIVARGGLNPRVLAGRLQSAVRAVDPSQAVYNVRPMTEVISSAIVPRRANTILITTFGIIAVVLAGVGVYGVIAFAVARRTREIGIRVALGARRSDVLSLIMREGLTLTLVGIGIGLAGAWALRKVMASLLYGIAPSDPLTFAGAVIALVVIALSAILLPARQALRVDPARTIRMT